MFLRRCERRKSGKRHTYWALVESYRTARGSRQRVVAYLGDLAPSEQDGWAKLGAHLQGDDTARRPQRTLFDPPRARDAADEESVKVRLNDIRLERLRDFGDVWLAWGLWQMLGLDGLLAKLLPEGREDVSWGTKKAGLTKLRAAAESGRLRDETLAAERLGRLKERFRRASQAFDVTIRKLPQPIGKQHLEVSWVRNEKFHEWSQLVDGCYLLRTNLTGVDRATLWKRYIQLTEAEWAFRIAKDELAIRPGWHRKEGRVPSHVLVCFLAYAMWKTLAGWMKGAGLGDAPRTLLYEFAKTKRGDIVLPAESVGGIRTTARLRHVTEPEAEQKTLPQRVGLQLPRRLKRIDTPAQL
jgi:hypothetical protein